MARTVPLRGSGPLGGPARPACPKHMVFGPCGGVRPSGGCEIDELPCPFVDAPLVTWPDAGIGRSDDRRSTSREGPVMSALRRGNGVICDFGVEPMNVTSVTEIAGLLGPVCDGVLIGDHQSRPDLPPAVLAPLTSEAGAAPWVTLTCRDRNRVVLESELEGLTALGVEGVHCVTGDARAPSVRPDVTQVFDLDSLRLAALARATGLAVSVAATPAAPPHPLRARRIVEKEHAGAEVCFINHCGGPAAVARFVAEARDAGATLAFIACVAVFTDAASAAVLRGFPGLELAAGDVERVLAAADPVAVGIDTAITQALEMLSVEGVDGVNLSGSASGGSARQSAQIMAAVAGGVRTRHTPARGTDAP
ncbi:MAG: methylenetetrahydrofolate reductase C-terminal domain-containing protein [Acidimicrobiales bacterium]